MNRLQLATLLSWGTDSGIHGRKRLQKVVFFLQEAGCPLNCQYTLHHFGPYSREVADACDEMVAAGLIEEGVTQQGEVTQYNYKLTPHTRSFLAKGADAQMQPFQPLAKSLITEKLWTLELGSTILYYYSENQDWSEAVNQACTFKGVSPLAPESNAALRLAKNVIASTQA